MSGVGKPMVMDKMTKERCLKKAGKLDFARVLVEVSANEELPSVLEIEYPPLGNRPARIGKLEVKYQWKPPLCTHCGTFGHSTLACKVRPRTVEEEAARNAKLKDVVSGDDQKKDGKGGMVNDGFVMVGKNNKPIGITSKTDNGVKNREGQNGNRQGFFQKKTYNKQYGGANGNGNGKSNFGQGNSVNNSWNQVKNKNNSEMSKRYFQGGVSSNTKSAPNTKSASATLKKNVKPAGEPKTLQQLSKDPNFKPKILVRGSGSKGSLEAVSNESIPISNSFQALEDQEMEQSNVEKDINVQEEFFSKVWPALKEEVDILMEAGIYPSRAVRLEWNIHQMDYFYKNCHKYQLNPSYEDEDVQSDVEGIASDMKPEYDIDAAGNNGLNLVYIAMKQVVWPKLKKSMMGYVFGLSSGGWSLCYVREYIGCLDGLQSFFDMSF
ncbi:hypothetical protein CTI12_AA271370 [Artemisia annua]|uniref:DUF4283 domain-containing protein n=1 Tax=Artemisia annua TaxID=35608 RepID=A0A2U1NFQ7_ARTAN|nr:hypothetical protein CTI12_AA271370 [Artemisia annua]